MPGRTHTVYDSRSGGAGGGGDGTGTDRHTPFTIPEGWSPRAGVYGVGAQAEQFGQSGMQGYDAGTRRLLEDRAYLQQIQRGQHSVSAEQLRQGLQQNVAALQAQSASARPGQAPMAARTAMIQGANLNSGLAGQQAVAGLAERNAAAQQLAQLNLQQRQQDLTAALGSHQNAMQGYVGQGQTDAGIHKTDQEYATAERNAWLGLAAGGAGALGMAMSDRRKKKDVHSGGAQADRMMGGLQAYSYKYKDPRDGSGQRLGVMAQDLERAGSRSVVNTPRGKMVHGGTLATEVAALMPRIDERLQRLERSKGRGIDSQDV